MQTIATAPEPVNWLVRTEWPAQLSHMHQQHLSNNQNAQDSNRVDSGQQHAWFADPRKGTVMSYAETQQLFPHLQMVSHSSNLVAASHSALLQTKGKVITQGLANRTLCTHA